MRFSRDRRGQSVVVGTVILFGFLIVALSLYQVQVVPQENGQTEFEHFEEVQNDLVELRNGISSAGSSERPQFVDVKLGTSYRTRTFTINPPDPAGTLRTSDAYPITITDDSDTTVNVSTRFIEYRPRYNEIESGSTWYDNSVLYLDEANSNRPAVIIEDQNILVDNDTLRLTAVQNDFSASGTRRVAVEIYPTTNATNLSELNGTLDIRIPTRLGSGDSYWNESIENGSITYQGMNDSAYPSSSEVSALLLQADSPDNVTVNSVGIQSEPTGETAKNNVGPVRGSESSSDNNVDTKPTFNTLTANSSKPKSNRNFEFTWSIEGPFDQITFVAGAESTTSTVRSGSASLDIGNGKKDVSATVEGPGGTEECTADIKNNEFLNKSGFTRTVSSA
ncbi:hypothetical protein PM023_06320 [Halorubrum ezzemoulense]|uniref:hypothetical protein n=1 Tax=Halorubrum ezzemoulense TaxID=337243 RepID=UPI0023304DD9|nr:hypothetical protein [Halorubrum ezzemoulense]MDB2224284.1 hypothetical protein [Halorubrum ezzemoulense]